MPRKAALLAAMLATANAVSACGGSAPTSKQTASKSGHSSTALQLAECLRTHGVPDFPDPQSGGGFAIQGGANGASGSISVDGHQLNVSARAFQRAMQACHKYQPQGPPISGAQLAKIKQRALKMAECMRAHGVPHFPDPQVTAGPGGHGIQVRIGGGGGGGASPSSKEPAPRESPAFQHAMTLCQPLMRVGPKAGKGGG